MKSNSGCGTFLSIVIHCRYRGSIWVVEGAVVVWVIVEGTTIVEVTTIKVKVIGIKTDVVVDFSRGIVQTT